MAGCKRSEPPFQDGGRVLAEAQRSLGMFNAREDNELPADGLVRFHLLAPSAGRSADVPEDAFWGRQDHELTPVIALVQGLVVMTGEVVPGVMVLGVPG
jgi:hypothetical protein